jgi:hypothetical protein
LWQVKINQLIEMPGTIYLKFHHLFQNCESGSGSGSGSIRTDSALQSTDKDKKGNKIDKKNIFSKGLLYRSTGTQLTVYNSTEIVCA